MKNQNLKVSIITVTFNSQYTLQETINSVKSQNYSNIEYIIIDGKSQDNTLSIIQENKKFISKFKSENDLGIYDAMNKGIKLSNGDIISILNSDDIFSSNDVISTVVQTFLSNPKVDLVYGDIIFFNKSNNITRIWQSSEKNNQKFSNGWHPPHPALFVTKKTYDTCGLFDIKLSLSADFDFMLRAFEVYGFNSRHIKKYLVNMRIGGATTNSIIAILRGTKQISKSFKKNNIDVNLFRYFFNRYKQKFKLIILNKKNETIH